LRAKSARQPYKGYLGGRLRRPTLPEREDVDRQR